MGGGVYLGGGYGVFVNVSFDENGAASHGGGD